MGRYHGIPWPALNGTMLSCHKSLCHAVASSLFIMLSHYVKSCCHMMMSNDARHEKTQGLCRCHTKGRMGARGRAHPSFGMTPTFREYDLRSQKTQILKSQCHTMTPTKTLRSVFSWHASYYAIIFLFADVSRCNGVAVDWLSSHIYWTDESRQTVEMADYTGQYRRILVHVGLKWPRGIVVDPIDRWVIVLKTEPMHCNFLQMFK